MMWLQYLLFICNLTYQPDVGFLAFIAETTRQIPISLAAYDELRGTVKSRKNDSGGANFLPYQEQWEASTTQPEQALKASLPAPKSHTHERLGTLKNALRGPPSILWAGTRIGSDVYGRYTLGSPVAPKRGVNSRLTTRMQKWNDYQARGGTKTMKEWTTHTRAQSWGHGAKTKMKFPSDHGNTAGSQTAWLYRLETDGGSFLKWGISQNPAARYTGTFMKGKRIFPLQSGQRRMVLRMERELVETTPGPLNFEPWAGARTQ